ncbi:MAG TPA: alanine:cation symporter family protein, partial [Candidatus Treponema faecavium]|nr:alanine:cation symporter family protein [Candidatus Treponema faecavium]
ILGWYFFGEVNVKALFGTKVVGVYAVLAVACVMIGSLLKIDLVWNLSDLFNGLMVFPNLIALLALSGAVSRAAREYDKPRAV